MGKKENNQFNLSRKLVLSATVVSLLCGAGTATANAAAEPQLKESAISLLTVKGIVTDENGNPIIGANVVEQGDNAHGVVTDIDGKFVLKMSKDSKVQVSYLGYKTQLLAPSAEMTVVMVEDNALDEVVVVGYGVQKKVNLTGAVAVVDVDKALEAKPVMDLSKSLQGVVPGLTITNTNGNINGQPSMQIRGMGTLTGDGGTPLFVVDGVQMNDVSLLNPQDIASISVLKDAASSSIYGSRAAFGVILITTKSGKKNEKATINYANNFSWDQPTILPDYPDVPTQLIAMNDAAVRIGAATNLFGMDFNEMLPYAIAWKEQNGGKKPAIAKCVRM